jgi:hypothetical protein
MPHDDKSQPVTIEVFRSGDNRVFANVNQGGVQLAHLKAGESFSFTPSATRFSGPARGNLEGALQLAQEGLKPGRPAGDVHLALRRIEGRLIDILRDAPPSSRGRTEDRIAEDAIDLFLEYRDKHGNDEDAAKAAALNEFAEARSPEVRATTDDTAKTEDALKLIPGRPENHEAAVEDGKTRKP